MERTAFRFSAAVRQVLENPDSNMHQLVMKIMKETDGEVLKATFENFFLNANIIGVPDRRNAGKNTAVIFHGQSFWIPLACNLHCTGCWAAEYGNKLNLTFDEIDSIIAQGKELGVYMYIYTGGEPLVRKKI